MLLWQDCLAAEALVLLLLLLVLLAVQDAVRRVPVGLQGLTGLVACLLERHLAVLIWREADAAPATLQRNSGSYVVS
jgi:hypothetical protein